MSGGAVKLIAAPPSFGGIRVSFTSAGSDQTPIKQVEILMKALTRIALELVALAGIIGGVATVALHYNTLPATIPVHFGISGEADGFGPKVWLLVFSGLSIVIYLAISVARQFPQCSNTPWKITPENRARQYALIQSLLTWLKAEHALLFGFLQWSMVQVALGREPGLNPWALWAWIAAMLVTVAAYFYRGYRAR